MALTDRQLLAYTDVVDIWAPSFQAGTNSDGFRKDATYTLVASNEACKYFSRPEDTRPSLVGRTERGAGIVRDECFRFDSERVILDGYIFKLKTPGHPQVNQFWVAKGNSVARISSGGREPNFAEVVVQRCDPGGLLT